MIIRKALSSDITKLYILEKKLFSAENFPLSRASLAYHLRNNLLYVAEVEGVLAGYGLVLIKHTHAKLYSLGVDEVYRGKKIAQKLLEELFRELESLGFAKVLLEVRTDNSAAIALYGQSGFSIKKQSKAFYLDGCDAFLMEKTLLEKKDEL